MLLSKTQLLWKNCGPKIINLLKYSTSSAKKFQEIRIPVPWGHIAGKWWGPTDQRPILTVHGWQDNCGSFNRLIPLLNEDVSFLAIDLPGHGFSSPYPSGLYYHFSNYLILTRYIVDYFSWPKTSLMGHSMGAINGFTYTMIYPDEVDFVICIDALKPMIFDNLLKKTAYNINKFLEYDQHQQSNEEPPSYTLDEMKKKMCTPHNNSIAYEHSHHILERNAAPSKKYPGQYYFTRDPRLKGDDLINWCQEEIVNNAKNVTCPILVGKSDQSSFYEDKNNFFQVLEVLKKSSRDCVFQSIKGTHHYHLNNPEEFAEYAREFIKKHNVEDRSLGGLKDEMQLVVAV